MQLVYKIRTERYGPNTQVLYAGVFQVGTVSYGMKSQNEAPFYQWRCTLPGMKADFVSGKQPTEENAMDKLKEVVLKWFELAIK